MENEEVKDMLLSVPRFEKSADVQCDKFDSVIEYRRKSSRFTAEEETSALFG